MKDRWLTLAEKLNALSARERGIIMATVIVSLYMIFQLAVFDPLIAERTRLAKLERDISKQIEKIRLENAEVIAASISDPNAETRQRITEQKAQAADYQVQIESITDKLIDPAQMSTVLASLLNKGSGLKLTSVKNHTAQTVSIGAEAGAELYQHTLSLEMVGKYDQVSAYLSQVETLPDKVFWKDLAFQMKNYPQGVLTLDVYTLSTSKDLIGVYR